ncbi:MAG: glycosyltransferase [Vicinamibacterales bacterium]
MKFCMVTTFFPPYHMGGDAVYISRLVEALARRGHQVDVVHDIDAFHASGGRAPHQPYVPPAGVSVYPLRSRFRILSPLLTHQTGRSWLKGALRERLARERYDVVHFHNISLIGLEAFDWAGEALRLMTLHEHWLVCPTSILWRYGRELCDREECVRCTVQAGRPPQWWRRGDYLRRQMGRLDAVIAVSRFVEGSHRARGFDWPFEQLPYFVPATRPVVEVTDAARPHPRPYFLFVGRLIQAKGVQTLFPAFSGTDGPDLLIAGDGDYSQELRRLAQGMPRVRFLGRQTHDVLQGLYHHAEAALVPSLCYETFGIVIIEAFAAGTPAIARDLGGLSEVVTDSGGGLLFANDAELREAIARVGAEPGLRQHLAANGARALREQWSEAPHIDGYMAILERARARRARAGGGGQ